MYISAIFAFTTTVILDWGGVWWWVSVAAKFCWPILCIWQLIG